MQILMIVVTRQVKFLLPVRKRVLLEMRFATSKPILSEGVTLHTMVVSIYWIQFLFAKGKQVKIPVP